MECPNCGKDVDNLEDHNSQFHNALECYAAERTKSEIKKEIDELQKFINVASFENPMNVGSDKEKLSALQVELANATEGGQGSGPRENFNKTMKDKPLPLLGPQENDYDRLLNQASSGQKIDPDLKELDQKLKDEAGEDYGVGDQGEIIQSDTVDVEGEEIEHQEDKPEMTQKDWDEELTGLKDDYATEEDGSCEFNCPKCEQGWHAECENPDDCKCTKIEESYAIEEDDDISIFDKDSDEKKDWNKRHIGATEDEEDDLVIDNDEDLFALHKGIMDKPVTEATEDETETSDDGTDVNTPAIPDVDNTDTDDTGINDRNRYPAEFSTETWDKRVTFNTKVEAFEGIGLNQGDALKLAELNWRELSIEVRGALNEFADDEKEEKRKDIQDAFNDEGAGVGADQPDTTIKDLDEIDYNIIGDNPVAVEKYECEHCNSGFKSNEALMIHFNDTHARAREFMLDVPNTCNFCGKEIPADISMGEHLAYDHGMSLDTKLENGQVEDGFEGGQGSGPHASLPEQAGRDPSLHYDPFAPDPDPVGDPRSAKLTEAEGGWDECQDCGFVGNTTEDTEKHKQETGHNTEHFGFSSAVGEGKIKGNENLKKKIISKEVERCPECDTPFEDKATLEQHQDMYKHGESWKPHVYKATEAVGYEEFREEDHPRDGGKFTTKGGGATKQKEKPKPTKNLNKVKDKILKHMGEPKTGDSWETNKYNKIKNLDGYPQHSSQLKNVGVKYKAPIMKAHLNDTYPDNKWSVRTEYFSMGSAINGHWTGGGQYPYGANEEVAQMYTDSGASNMMVDYSDTDNYVSLYDGRPREERHQYDPQTIAKSREERLEGWVRGALDNVDYTDSRNWSQTVAKHLAKDGEIISFQGMTDAHKEQIKKVWGEFQEQERKEGGTGHKAKQVSKSTSPASYTQQYMGEDPDKPSEVPIDPETKEELPASPYHSKDPAINPEYTKTTGTPEDAKRQMQQQASNLKSKHSGASFDWQKGGESYAKEVEHEKCPHCNFETSWKEGDSWQEEDAKTEMNNHIVTHGTEGLGQDVSDNWDYGINKQEILDRAGVDNKWADYAWYELPKEIQDQITNNARSYEAMYGYGSATGRMSPRDAWEQGASSEGGMNPVFQEFRTLHWSELPADIQELWKSELEYLTSGEARAKEFQPERQGKRVKLLTGDYAGKTGTISAVSIFSSGFHVRVDGVHNEYANGIPVEPTDVEFLGGEAKATEDTFSSYDIKGNLLSSSSDPDISGLSEDEIFDLPVWKDKEEAKRLYQQLKDSEGFVTEDDPDFENDPDYQGFVDGKKKESSQYTQQGITDAMADPDYDKLDEVKANEYMSHDDVLIEGVSQWHEQGGNVEADAQQIADQLNQEYGADFEDHPSGKFTADHVRNVYNAIKHTRLGV